MSIPSLFFRTAILLALAGILLGIFMGMNQDFRLAHMHAHLNLLGWVSFFVFGGYYALAPQAAEGVLPKVHYTLCLIGLLVFMIVASKGAAGVTGAGLATLAGGLQSHRPDLLDGVGLIVGIDRFMSEARAVTNFSGNAVATLLVGSWTKTVDKDQVNTVLRGDDPFDELTMVDDHHPQRAEEPAQERIPAPA